MRKTALVFSFVFSVFLLTACADGKVGLDRPWSTEQTGYAELYELNLVAKKGDLLLVRVESGKFRSEVSVSSGGVNLGGAVNTSGPANLYVWVTENKSYTLWVYSLARRFSVTVTRHPFVADVPQVATIQLGSSIRGNLDVGDARRGDNKGPAEWYTLAGTQGQELELRLNSDDANTFVSIAGHGLDASNDDDNTSFPTNRWSRLAVTLPVTGEYRVEASSPDSSIGPYTLEVVDGATARAEGADPAARQARHRQALVARIPEFLHRGNELLRQGDLGGARYKFDTVRWLDDSNIPARLGQGLVDLREDNHIGAKFAAEDVLRRDPNNQGARSLLQTAVAIEQKMVNEWRDREAQRARENQALMDLTLAAFAPLIANAQGAGSGGHGGGGGGPVTDPTTSVLLAIADAAVVATRSEMRVIPLDFQGSRTACLRHQVEPGSGSDRYQQFQGRGSTSMLGWEVFTIENTCDEPLVVFGAACMDGVTQKSYPGSPGVPAYGPGQQVSLAVNLGSGYQLRRGQKAIVAWRGRNGPNPNPVPYTLEHPSEVHIHQVSFGAVGSDTWQAGAADVIAWRDRVRVSLAKALRQDPNYNLGGKIVSTPPEWRWGSCSEVNVGS